MTLEALQSQRHVTHTIMAKRHLPINVMLFMAELCKVWAVGMLHHGIQLGFCGYLRES